MRIRPLLRSRARISTVLATAITGIFAFVITGAPGVALASHAVTSVMPHT